MTLRAATPLPHTVEPRAGWIVVHDLGTNRQIVLSLQYLSQYGDGYDNGTPCGWVCSINDHADSTIMVRETAAEIQALIDAASTGPA